MDKLKKKFIELTKATDPRDMVYLYNDLPDDIYELCKIVNSLLIHPSHLSEYQELVVSEDEIWDNEPKTVHEILCKLNSRNKDSLLIKRTDSEKVVITCRGFTILLTSILRYKGIPARARAGFAPYICEGVNIDHWICEYWDESQDRWTLLDADFLKIDMPPKEFRYTADVYLDCLNHKDNPFKYGCDDYWGMCYIISYLNLDFLSLVYDELWYNPRTYITNQLTWENQSVYEKAVQKLTDSERQLLTEIANLMTDVDMNYSRLLELVESNEKLLPKIR